MATFGDVKIKLEEQPDSEGDTEDTEDEDDGMIKGRCYVPPGCPNKEQLEPELGSPAVGDCPSSSNTPGAVASKSP